ncbi:MAG: hypothetical protein HUN04_18815 [Desulfobacter sp.]|nr:MAG: hypothetical protein HUN04_18815 [Desulfobacter sp.]
MTTDHHIPDEKQILASFISILPEAILMCDPKGICLVHDLQSQAFLAPGQAETDEPVAMVGRPVASFIDKGLVEHALNDIKERLGRGMSRPISGFILQKKDRVLQTRVVPILTGTGMFGGFVIILTDITQQAQAEKRVERLLTTLSKNARSPMASIRAAVEAMKGYPAMDEERRQQFIDIIYSESLILSDILEQVSQEYGRLLHGKKALKPLQINDLMRTLSRRSHERLGIVCQVTPARAPAGIKAEAYTFIASLLFLLDQLRTETGVDQFSISSRLKNEILYLDLAWQGAGISPDRLHRWESRNITDKGAAGICLKEVLDRHQCAVWAYPAGENDPPFIRIFIPLDDARGAATLEPPTMLPESRPQIRDLELFHHSDQAMALDNRLMTELAYTALIREINQARGVEEIMGKHSQLPRMIHNMLSSGTTVRTITWLITAFSDAILGKLLTFALEALGPAPAPFAFITLGSEGRKEQTLKTDQDNAIIHSGSEKDTAYFLALGEKVCTWLDRAGYDFCRGGIMAKNPKWCQPLSVWKSYFSDWIRAPSPEDLLHTSIFFDLRFAFGDRVLVDSLAAHLLEQLSGWTGFFRNLAENAVYFKPPLGLLGRFHVEKNGPHKKCIDLKMAGTPIVDFARIYSLKYGIPETSTLDRLFRMYENRVLSRQAYNELDQAYSLLIQLRFRAQIQHILVENTTAHNYVNPRHLTPMERQMLKQVLKRVKSAQDRLRVDLIGATDQQMG